MQQRSIWVSPDFVELSSQEVFDLLNDDEFFIFKKMSVEKSIMKRQIFFENAKFMIIMEIKYFL